ncbi:hypothetical protein E3U43_016717 [Larimichthys crocea]|uniref:Uncharacterized protein n=1 Tax=Larimichthys crocea TaxID=215358 RepID=A0ACD3QIM0_LARCR|nr:hypothetical protein E3U43_016717 [Larimichthys crocea]
MRSSGMISPPTPEVNHRGHLGGSTHPTRGTQHTHGKKTPLHNAFYPQDPSFPLTLLHVLSAPLHGLANAFVFGLG